MNACGGWESVRKSVRQRVGLRAFDTWFGALDGRVEGRTLVVRCPDGFVKNFVEGRYGAVIAEAAGPERVVEYRLSDPAVAAAAVKCRYVTMSRLPGTAAEIATVAPVPLMTALRPSSI